MARQLKQKSRHEYASFAVHRGSRSLCEASLRLMSADWIRHKRSEAEGCMLVDSS